MTGERAKGRHGVGGAQAAQLGRDGAEGAPRGDRDRLDTAGGEVIADPGAQHVRGGETDVLVHGLVEEVHRRIDHLEVGRRAKLSHATRVRVVVGEHGEYLQDPLQGGDFHDR
jgi:hypothetical protein